MDSEAEADEKPPSLSARSLPEDSGSWPFNLEVIFWVGLTFFFITMLVELSANGSDALHAEPVFWTAVVAFGVALVGALPLWLMTPTRKSVRKKDEERRRRRGSETPQDEAILREATVEERARWYTDTRSHFRSLHRLRIVLLIIVVPLVAVLIVDSGKGLPVLVIPVLVSLGTGSFLLLFLLTDVSLKKDPLLIVGTIEGGVHRRDLERKKVGTLSDWAQYGSSRLIEITVESTSRLTADGKLMDAAGTVDSGTVGVRASVLRELIEGERRVLICDARGLVVDTLDSLHRRIRVPGR